jgi:hypothetical protein
MNNQIFYIVYFLIKISKKFQNTSKKELISFQSKFYYFFLNRDLLLRFKTQELIHWKDILNNFEHELKHGTKDDPATNVFAKTDDGNKCWEDFKVRIVEHVTILNLTVPFV